MRYESRPWGEFEVLYEDDFTWLKLIRIAPRSSLSLQVHERREEMWRPVHSGCRAIIGHQDLELHPDWTYTVKKGQKHRLYNPCDHWVNVLEWAVGRPREDDIIRLEDEYGRTE